MVEEKPEEESTLTSKTFGLGATAGLRRWLAQGTAWSEAVLRLVCFFFWAELGNTISSLFGGGSPGPEALENVTEAVHVSKGWSLTQAGLELVSTKAGVCVGGGIQGTLD